MSDDAPLPRIVGLQPPDWDSEGRTQYAGLSLKFCLRIHEATVAGLSDPDDKEACKAIIALRVAADIFHDKAYRDNDVEYDTFSQILTFLADAAWTCDTKNPLFSRLARKRAELGLGSGNVKPDPFELEFRRLAASYVHLLHGAGLRAAKARVRVCQWIRTASRRVVTDSQIREWSDATRTYYALDRDPTSPQSRENYFHVGRTLSTANGQADAVQQLENSAAITFSRFRR